MNRKVFLLVVGFFAGCATAEVPRVVSQQQMLEFSERTLAEWSPDRAVEEAKNDIRTGKLKIYISGTIAAYSPGVEKEQYPLIVNLPKANAGIGCVIEDSKLRNAQFEYAKKYNEYVVNYLLQK